MNINGQVMFTSVMVQMIVEGLVVIVVKTARGKSGATIAGGAAIA